MKTTVDVDFLAYAVGAPPPDPDLEGVPVGCVRLRRADLLHLKVAYDVLIARRPVDAVIGSDAGVIRSTREGCWGESLYEVSKRSSGHAWNCV